MMIGEPNHHHNPTIHVPPWLSHTHRTPTASSPLSVTTNANATSPTDDYLLNCEAISTALQRYLPSNGTESPESAVSGVGDDFDLLPALEAYYTSDEFRMYDFKVRKCTRVRAHDWTECPFAHPGEKARRRDPRLYEYSGTACTDFRKGNCKKGDACEFAHGVFECWLHPSRYRTQACKDGPNCKRRVCFFAHTPEELRVVSLQPSLKGVNSHDYYPFDEFLVNGSVTASPTVTPLMESPPVSPMAISLSRSFGSNSSSELVASMRNLQLSKVKSMPKSSWSVGMGSPRFGSAKGSLLRPGFYSLPSTPTRPGIGFSDMWDKAGEQEEPVMERVESGRELRARMFEKLSKENPLNCPDPVEPSGKAPDMGWVSDLVR
ncbi:hypothetical protein Ancab_028487 [Ancistrocladus abbreviatus]